MQQSNRRIYQFSEYSVDETERLVLRNGSPIPLGPKVFETLLLLLENAGRLVTKREFMERVWPDSFVEDVALAQNISQIRKALSANGTVIETVSKRGYRFALPVHLVYGDDSAKIPSKGSHTDLVTERWPAPIGEAEDTKPGQFLASGPDHSAPTISSPALKSAVPIRPVVLSLITLLLTGAVAWTFRQHWSSTYPPPVLIPLLDISGEERMPALSPDGSRIAFFRHSQEQGKSGIYVEVVGTQSLLQISNGETDSHPAWSPDGREIAFLRDSGQPSLESSPYSFAIMVVPSLGGKAQPVYSGAQVPLESPTSISFSADSKQIAFAEWDVQNQQSSIKVISLVNSKVQNLTFPPTGYHDVAPTFSPDGGEIAFVRSTGPIFVDDVYVMPSAGGKPRQLTFDHRRVFSAPAWTSDGEELIFSSTHAGMKSLWRVPARGGPIRSVAGSGIQVDNPTVSLAGGEIAYEYTIEEENLWKIKIKPESHLADGDAVGLLSPRTSNLMPQFSPDGRKIAFESDRSGYEEIWTCDSDGSSPTQVTKLERYAGSPHWSPDARYIAFDFRSDRHSQIYVVEVATGITRPVIGFADADSVLPSWSRDGTMIYFASNRAGKDFHVWKVQLDGEKAVQVTRNPGFLSKETPDGVAIIYSRLTEPGLWSVPRDAGDERGLWRGLAVDNWANWDIAKDGIYLTDSRPNAPSEIKFLITATSQVTSVSKLARPAFYGMTLAPDGTEIVYSQRDRNQHDIVIMKNFH